MMKEHTLNVIILAAGVGTRFSSHLAKPFYPLAGLELVGHVLKSVAALKPSRTCIVIQKPYKDNIARVLDTLSLPPEQIQISFQEQAKGTGHATKCAWQDMQTASLSPHNHVLILPADVPLISTETLKAFTAFHVQQSHDISVMGFYPQVPTGYGRLLTKNAANLQAIREEKDCSDTEKEIALCNSGILLARAQCLNTLLEQITNDNAQKEYYLTDIIALGKQNDMTAGVYTCEDAQELQGINTRSEFAKVEWQYQERKRAYFLDTIGVSITAPHTVFFNHDTTIGAETTIGPYVVFGPHVTVGNGCDIKAFSDIADARIGNHASIGPFARIRGNATIHDKVKIGNFVEIKHSELGESSKAAHLSYIGDAKVGKNVNIGAGVVFANYDGKNKHKTTAMDNSFIGSNATLVAPVVIGEKSIVTAGSTIVEDVPKDFRGFARSRQINKPSKSD